MGTKTTRKLVTLPIETNERLTKFADNYGLSISTAACMLLTGALNRVDGIEPPVMCGCHETTCVRALGDEPTGQCRLNRTGEP